MDIIRASLKRLDYLEEQRNWSASVKDQFRILKIELKFLRTFIKYREVKRVEYQDLIKPFLEIVAIIQDVGEVILSLYVEATDGKLPLYLDGSLYSTLEKIELIKPVVDRCFHDISQLRNPWDTSRDDMVELSDFVLENLKDLLLQSEVNWSAGVKKLIDTLERRLRFLRNSLHFAAKVSIDGYDLWYLQEEVEYAATAAASLPFSCWINKKMDDENKEPSREFDLDRALHYRPKPEDSSLSLCVMEFSESLASDDADALMAGYIDFLLQHLAELLRRDDSSLETPTKNQFESLHEETKFLRTLLLTTPMQYADSEKSYLLHEKAQINKVALLIEDFYVGNMDEAMMTKHKDKLLYLLDRLKIIHLFYLIDRVSHEASSIAIVKDQFKTLCKDMRLFRIFLIDTRNGYDMDEIFKDIHSHIEAVALEARSAIYSFHVTEIKKDMAKEMSRLLPDLLEKIKLIKADMRKIYPRATSSNFPKTGGLRGTTIFLKELNKLLNRRDYKISRVKPHVGKAAKLWIESFQNELQFLISFLENFEEKCTEIGELKALEMRIMNMANEAKYATEPIFVRDYPFWYGTLMLSDVMEEVKLIKKEIERINEKISSEMLSSQDNTLAMGEVFVGFKGEAQDIIETLIRGAEQLHIISIIGMAGLGKTTLAKKLYSNSSVVGYFDVQAWCCVSQVFQERQVLLDILRGVDELPKEIYDWSDEDLADLLYKRLRGRRFLIVMDDMWDIKAWTALSRCFHDDRNGSRIMFTTRLQEIALNVQARSIRYPLRHFKDEESWELLQKKLPGGKCPTEQLEIMKQIAKKCKGLPLAVVLMAGVLSRKKREEWRQVAESLSRHIDKDLQNLSMEVLELSYKNLPNHLRPCFLYLGAFPEDKEIPPKKLMWLWVAEGFIQKTEQKSSEDIAKDYLMDLIGRSLVIVSERGSNGGIKACRIHDLLRSFSLAKAKEESFLLLLDGNDKPFAAPNLKFHQQVDGYVESYNSNPITYEQYRLCIYSMLNDFDKWPSSLHVCSLLHFAPKFHLNLKLPYDASSIFSNFKFLNVLDLGRLPLEDLNSEIELLVQLRLLAVWIRSDSIPSSIANLKNLETFLVKGMRKEVVIPDATLEHGKFKASAH